MRKRGWFSDPTIVETLNPYVIPEIDVPTVDEPAVILYDANERPVRRRIGFVNLPVRGERNAEKEDT